MRKLYKRRLIRVILKMSYRQILNINCDLQNQIVNLKAALKIEQEQTKLLRDEITVKNLKLNSLEKEFNTLQLEFNQII